MNQARSSTQHSPFRIGKSMFVEVTRAVVPKTIMFFFGYEVVMGEMRGKVGSLVLASAPSLLALAIRGLSGW